MNNEWTLKTWGDGWSGGSEIKDGDDLIVASHCSLYGEQIMREHEAYEKQREAIRELIDALEAFARGDVGRFSKVGRAIEKAKELL